MKPYRLSSKDNIVLSSARVRILAHLGFADEGRVKKIEKFSVNGEPMLVVEWPLKTQQSLWVREDSVAASARSSVANEVREYGVKKDGGHADGSNPGRHTGPNGYLGPVSLICFHPTTELEMKIVLESLAA